MNRLVKIKDLKSGKVFIASFYNEEDYHYVKKHKRRLILEQRDFAAFDDLIGWCNNHNILPY